MEEKTCKYRVWKDSGVHFKYSIYKFEYGRYTILACASTLWGAKREIKKDKKRTETLVYETD